jgi:hypothetical protein
VFGVPISVKAAVRTWRKRFFVWMLLTVVARFFQAVTGFCFVFPSVIVTAFVGFLPEVLYLEQSSANGIIARLNWLSGGGGFGRSLGRCITLLAFWCMLAFGLFLLMDFLCTAVLNRPIFFARISFDDVSSENVPVYLWETWLRMISDDPRVATVTQLAVWLPYPVIRLTWFFSYLDQRIRNECWDLQLQYRIEASRLEQMA